MVSRLVPGGRIPVLLVASLTGYPWLRFASAGAVAALLWAALYSVIGVAGDAVFHDETTAVRRRGGRGRASSRSAPAWCAGCSGSTRPPSPADG